METEILRQLASTGVVGVFLVITLFALRSTMHDLKECQKRLEEEIRARVEDAKSKDARLEEEMNDRIEDANRFTQMAMTLQQEVIQSVGQLSAITREIAGLGELIRDWHREHGSHPPPSKGARTAEGGKP